MDPEEQYDGDDLLLSTGRGIFGNGRIIGIDCDGYVFGGYDSGIDTDSMTPAERSEFADIMIARWRRFGEPK